MNIKIKSLILIIFNILLFIISIYLYSLNYINYSILIFAIGIVILLILVNYLKNNNNPNYIYENTIKNILNTYDSILVKSKEVPILDNKNIIIAININDLIDAQREVRKPIYYFEQSDNCSFVLFDNNEALIYIIKKEESITSPIEIEINNNRIQNKNKSENDIDAETLEQISKTTIVKLPNKKSYKISPISDKKLDENVSIEKNISNDISINNKDNKEIESLEEEINDNNIPNKVNKFLFQ